MSFLKKRVCEKCGKEYRPNSTTQKYCQKYCQKCKQKK